MGFTLMETLVAMMLSSMLIILVSTTFLVQNQYYSMQTLHAGAHDNARVATERVAGELRSVMVGGVVVAGPRTLTVRSPMVITSICSRQGGGDGDVHTEGGEAELDTDEVAGVALRDSLSGTWTYRAATWSYLNGSASSADRCFAGGADTVGAYAEFHRIRHLDDFTPTPTVGDVLMLYRETTYKIQDSDLDPGRLGLFRRRYGGTFVEFATGMDSTAQFRYRTGGMTYADTVLAASLGLIDAIGIVADARKPARTALQEDVTFGWSVNVALRSP